METVAGMDNVSPCCVMTYLHKVVHNIVVEGCDVVQIRRMIEKDYYYLFIIFWSCHGIVNGIYIFTLE